MDNGPHLNSLLGAKIIFKSSGEVRKTRSDKKRDVKPTIPIELKDSIYRLSYITYTPVKTVCEELVSITLSDDKVYQHLSKFFQRDLKHKNTIYFGSIENPRVQKTLMEKCERIKIRFSQPTHNTLAALSFALDCSLSRVVAILLDISMRNVQYMNQYMRKYLDGNLNENQIQNLQTILKRVNSITEKNHSLASLIALIVDEVKAPVHKIKDAIREFLNKTDD